MERLHPILPTIGLNVLILLDFGTIRLGKNLQVVKDLLSGGRSEAPNRKGKRQAVSAGATNIRS